MATSPKKTSASEVVTSIFGSSLKAYFEDVVSERVPEQMLNLARQVEGESLRQGLPYRETHQRKSS
jgi:hypothetical protein